MREHTNTNFQRIRNYVKQFSLKSSKELNASHICYRYMYMQIHTTNVNEWVWTNGNLQKRSEKDRIYSYYLISGIVTENVQFFGKKRKFVVVENVCKLNVEKDRLRKHRNVCKCAGKCSAKRLNEVEHVINKKREEYKTREINERKKKWK